MENEPFDWPADPGWTTNFHHSRSEERVTELSALFVSPSPFNSPDGRTRLASSAEDAIQLRVSDPSRGESRGTALGVLSRALSHANQSIPRSASALHVSPARHARVHACVHASVTLPDVTGGRQAVGNSEISARETVILACVLHGYFFFWDGSFAVREIHEILEHA